MEDRLKHELLDLFDDLTPVESKRLVYHCLGLKQKEIADRLGVENSTISMTFTKIKTIIDHDNNIKTLQELLRSAFFLD